MAIKSTTVGKHRLLVVQVELAQESRQAFREKVHSQNLHFVWVQLSHIVHYQRSYHALLEYTRVCRGAALRQRL
jgi:hypothetical protein